MRILRVNISLMHENGSFQMLVRVVLLRNSQLGGLEGRRAEEARQKGSSSRRATRCIRNFPRTLFPLLERIYPSNITPLIDTSVDAPAVPLTILQRMRHKLCGSAVSWEEWEGEESGWAFGLCCGKVQ